MDELSRWPLLIYVIGFVVFLFLPIIYPLYLWHIKKNQTSEFLKIARWIRRVMGVLSLSAAVFGCLFVFAIHMMNIESVPNPGLRPDDLKFIENYLTVGGITTVIICLLVGWLLLKRWK
jgi:TRAP-type C4-dicarboxylate transport system permease small subunit